MRPEPLPVNELDALLKVLLPVKLVLPFTLAKLESLDKAAEDTWIPFILYNPPLITQVMLLPSLALLTTQPLKPT